MSYLVKTPATIQYLFPKLKWKLTATERELYLTFDDGPIPSVTEWVLDLLNSYNAKATFFCIGNNVNKHPEIFSKIIKNGHSIGNHTMNHENGWNTKNKHYFQSIKECANVVKSKLFRPPYGRITPSQTKEISNKFDIIMWDVMPGDFDLSVTPQQCLINIQENATNGSIIVLHDSIKAEKNLRYVLPKVLDYYSEKGFIFKAL